MENGENRGGGGGDPERLWGDDRRPNSTWCLLCFVERSSVKISISNKVRRAGH